MPTTSLESEPREQATTPRRGRGFSLLELVLVMVVAGILTGIAVPRMAASTDQARARQAGARIESLLAEASNIARAGSKAVTIEIDTTEDTITLSGPAGKSALDLRDAPYRAEISAVSLKGGAVLTIDGMGVPDSGGAITVRSGSAECVVTLDDPPEGSARIPIVLK